MRTREKIEDSAFAHAGDEMFIQHTVLEVLLDIRDLLAHPLMERTNDGNIRLISHEKESICQHESTGMVYTSLPPQYKCKKCGKMYT